MQVMALRFSPLTRRLGYAGGHALAAGLFFFVLERYALDQTVEAAVKWAAFFAVAAALVAWSQTRP